MSESKPVVLAVDDIPANLDLLREILSDEYKVKVANSGEKALQLANRDPRPDIILLDIMMPGMSGYDVCQELKQRPDTTPIPVVFVTAMSEVEDEQRGLALGAVDYITKPYDHDIVKARVRAHIDNYARTQQLIAEVRELRDSKARSFTDFEESALTALIQSGEGPLVEFRPALRWNFDANRIDEDIEDSCLKTVAGFLNSEGGTLFVGVNDEGAPVGLNDDRFEDEDELLLHWINLIRSCLGPEFIPYIRSIIHTVGDHRLLIVECLPSARPVFLTRDGAESFHVRIGNATQALKTSESLAYIEQQFSAGQENLSKHETRGTDDSSQAKVGNTSESKSPLSQWLDELKQRRVIRTAILYIVVAWSFTEIATTAADTLDAPSWIGRAIMLGFIGGFPIAMLLAWLYDLRITRTEDSEASSKKTRAFRLLGAIVVASALVIATKVLFGSGL